MRWVLVRCLKWEFNPKKLIPPYLVHREPQLRPSGFYSNNFKKSSTQYKVWLTLETELVPTSQVSLKNDEIEICFHFFKRKEQGNRFTLITASTSGCLSLKIKQLYLGNETSQFSKCLPFKNFLELRQQSHDKTCLTLLTS